MGWLYGHKDWQFNDQVDAVGQCRLCALPFIKQRWFAALRKIATHYGNDNLSMG